MFYTNQLAYIHTVDTDYFKPVKGIVCYLHTFTWHRVW